MAFFQTILKWGAIGVAALLLVTLITFFFSNGRPDVRNWEPAPSPDSKAIVFATEVDGNFEIIKLNRETGQTQQLTNNEYDDLSPDMTPEGDKIVFVSHRNEETDLYLLDLVENNETRLTESPSQDLNPRWNGNHEVLFNSNRTDEWEIFSISVPEGELSRITQTEN